MNKTLVKIHDLNMESQEYGDMIHVSFQVPDHGLTGLLGLDGSGIELLCRVLCGDSDVFEGAKGSVWLDGKKVRHAGELGKCVRYIRMADAILENWTISEYLGLNRVRLYIGKKQKQAMQQHAADRFQELGRTVDVSRPIREVSELDRRISRIIHETEKGTRMLIIEDECLGMKTAEIQEYAHVLERIADKGIMVLFRAQSLQVSGQICRSFLVFRRGRLVKYWKRNGKESPEILTKYLLGNTIAAEIKTLQHTQRNVRERKNITYQVRDLYIGGKRFGFHFYEGEVYVLMIENNLYCREFFDHLSGRKISMSTRYYLGFKELHGQKQKDFIRSRIVSTMLGNEEYELFGNMSVEDNLLMPSLQKFSSFRYFQQSDNLHRAARGMTWLDPEKKDTPGGRMTDQSSRIRVDMERWLMFRPKVMLLFEPFSTCDTYGATLISTYIKQFANIGASVIVVKSNEEFMPELADHIFKIEV